MKRSKKKPLRIGLSACFFHADPKRAIFKGKTLQYVEQSMAHLISSQGDIVYMIPSQGNLDLFVKDLDGLVLQGGSDVAPETYGETPLKPEWKGDRIRDLYEIELVKKFMKAKKPILGICRGAQLVNVALGGTLLQDITMQVPDSLVHRDWEIYDQNFHVIDIVAGSGLSKVYGKAKSGKVNSVHHQGLKDIGKGLVVEARSRVDGIVEAVRWKGPSYLVAVQWHPEFHDKKDKSLLAAAPLLKEFLAAARKK